MALYCSHYISMIFIILSNGLNFTYLQMIDATSNRFYEHESLQQLQENINAELINIHTWLNVPTNFL